jgi:hypothetical protein
VVVFLFCPPPPPPRTNHDCTHGRSHGHLSLALLWPRAGISFTLLLLDFSSCWGAKHCFFVLLLTRPVRQPPLFIFSHRTVSSFVCTKQIRCGRRQLKMGTPVRRGSQGGACGSSQAHVPRHCAPHHNADKLQDDASWRRPADTRSVRGSVLARPKGGGLFVC